MKSYEVYLTPDAIQDLTDIYEYIAAKSGLPQVAWAYIEKLRQKCHDLKITPLIGQQRNDLRKNLRIIAIDKSIELLYSTGYMHNHFRMYIASITCNIGKAHWLQPSLWMYYHLLDGDLASNSLSWQWVAASFSSKKYYCNQENINKYSKSQQQNTFLDTSYEKLITIEVPEALLKKNNFFPKMKLPETVMPVLKRNLPTLVYNSCNLDPLWHAGKNVNRILLLEPAHFKKFPVSGKVLQFFMELSKNIDDIQIFVGEFDELAAMVKEEKLIFKSHPAFLHYHGTAEEYETLFPEVTDYYSSFSAYWKRCEKYL